MDAVRQRLKKVAVLKIRNLKGYFFEHRIYRKKHNASSK